MIESIKDDKVALKYTSDELKSIDAVISDKYCPLEYTSEDSKGLDIDKIEEYTIKYTVYGLSYKIKVKTIKSFKDTDFFKRFFKSL